MRWFPALVTACIWSVSTATAEEPSERLMRAMHVQDTMDIIAQEGRNQAQDFSKTLFESTGGAFFNSQVAELYDPSWMRGQIAQSVSVGMSDTQIEQAAIFFESQLGQTIVSLENSARQAMTDDAVYEMAQQSYAQAETDSNFYRLVDEYVQINNLIELNVRSSFNAEYAFIRGLTTGQEGATDDDALLAKLLSKGEKTEEETTEWIYSYLLLAYKPLNEAQMRENIAFSRTEAGRALNKSLFEAYDQMMVEITFNLGEAVARAMRASDL